MMFGRVILLGVTAGVLSGVACVVFANVYKEAMFIDFSPLISNVNYFAACIIGCLLASLGFWGILKIVPKYGEIIFNFLFAIVTFSSIVGPIGYVWPLKADPDLTAYFPMFAITLHFFPIVVWLTLKPLFIKK